MAKSKTQKAEALQAIDAVLKDAKSVVFAGFNKLTVGEVTAARKAMRAVGVTLLTVKKTLLAKTLSAHSFGEIPSLTGQVMLAYGKDMLAPAREVLQVGKKLEGKLSILGGIFEGVFADKAKMTIIAEIPSREVLLAQVVNIINSPIQGLVIALNAVAGKKSA
ncbi:MAG: 50S ribosomal protein L10 [Candidatus Taylorbacteria bacterium RIFCSPHIGHO2_01_FULL_46_22b]|uniref:Large ribosomal subunit protein uL10 n=1 Tax=Candidatus Taylorbacteria bacterium RIFCSPHIGHO2_01_FULL_46_22b TaxID=1802301 RepID=A0A1G2M4A1_9BACT|nr:MAG: 50S ribosomal protein L10 [Candidatus Taylorbacteria bacterium RIFCSPHIGHO2_01_FULL_46_22b]